MKFINNGTTYTVAFFFGKTGEPKQRMDETTPCVRTTDDKSFLCAECEFLDEADGTRTGKIGFTDEDFEDLG